MVSWALALPGINVNACTNSGVTPLMFACKICSINSVNALLTKGANPFIYDQINLTARNQLPIFFNANANLNQANANPNVIIS